ncbi:hypothetical protein WJX72_002865 [[Myrmecia] bisecta]|uniref:Saposin B-type domain-containing protein n=1 Tax=[Myrmecia] bisecta TaxID=41462 RepID=A0AAW1PTB8_9CHLO
MPVSTGSEESSHAAAEQLATTQSVEPGVYVDVIAGHHHSSGVQQSERLLAQRRLMRDHRYGVIYNAWVDRPSEYCLSGAYGRFSIPNIARGIGSLSQDAWQALQAQPCRAEMALSIYILAVIAAALPLLIAATRDLPLTDPCASCVRDATQLYSDLCAPEAQAKLVQELTSSSCSELPAVAQAQCQGVVSAVVPTMCSKMTASEAASKICSRPEVCIKAALMAKDDDTCSTCKMVILELANMLHDPNTQKEIIEYAKEACAVLKQMEDQCDVYVETYGPLVLNMAMQYLQPNLCPSSAGPCPCPCPQPGGPRLAILGFQRAITG